jgi:hypothetical protein
MLQKKIYFLSFVKVLFFIFYGVSLSAETSSLPGSRRYGPGPAPSSSGSLNLGAPASPAGGSGQNQNRSSGQPSSQAPSSQRSGVPGGGLKSKGTSSSSGQSSHGLSSSNRKMPSDCELKNKKFDFVTFEKGDGSPPKKLCCQKIKCENFSGHRVATCLSIHNAGLSCPEPTACAQEKVDREESEACEKKYNYVVIRDPGRLPMQEIGSPPGFGSGVR